MTLKMANSMKSKFDAYGFEFPDGFDHTPYEAFTAQYLSVLARRAAQWKKLIGNSKSVKRSRTVKRYCRKGVPNEYRGMVWMHVSGAQVKMDANPDLYNTFLRSDHDPEIVEIIEKDVPRTYPENIYFRDAPNDPNCQRKPLTNVMLALSHQHKSIGYCQGWNYMAALLLLVTKNEQKVFWLMDYIVTQLNGYYTLDMKGSLTDYEVVSELIKEKIPDVYSQLDRTGTPWSLIISKWLLCIFADVLPVETTLRIWDSFFYEGPKIIFRVAITLFSLNRGSVYRAQGMPDIVTTFKEFIKEPAVLNCHTFMQSVFSESGQLKRKSIDKHRDECRERV